MEQTRVAALNVLGQALGENHRFTLPSGRVDPIAHDFFLVGGSSGRVGAAYVLRDIECCGFYHFSTARYPTSDSISRIWRVHLTSFSGYDWRNLPNA
jgi:hypothetical protein